MKYALLYLHNVIRFVHVGSWPRQEILKLDIIRIYLACEVIGPDPLITIYNVAVNTFGITALTTK